MRTLLCSLVVLSVSGCQSQGVGSYGGTVMWELFPFDGTRTWEYLNENTELTWTLVATMRSEEPEKIGGINVYTIDYTTHCVAADPDCVEGALVRTVEWSSDAVEGVHIHGWAEEGGDPIPFDPPLQVTGREAKVGDTVESVTAGQRWTSDFVSFEPCPVRMTVTDWPDCARFRIDDNDGDDLTGMGIVGDYWAVRTFGVAGIDLVGTVSPKWELFKHVCEPSETCDGVW